MLVTTGVRPFSAALGAAARRRWVRLAVVIGGIAAVASFTPAAAKPLLPSIGPLPRLAPIVAKPPQRSTGLLFNGALTQSTFRPWSDFALSDRMVPPWGHARLIKVVHVPGQQSRLWAARFTVTPQRRWLQGSSYLERTEIVASPAQTDAYSGRSAWYGWATYFPSGFQAAPNHDAVIAQAHSTDLTCAPPNLYVEVNTQPGRPSSTFLHKIELNTYGGPVTNGLTAGATSACSGIQGHQFIFGQFRARHWFRFVMHVMWSSDPNVGYVELWVDGRLVVPFTHLPTLYSTSPAYWKQGLYEFASPNAATDYELGVRVGSSYAAVAY